MSKQRVSPFYRPSIHQISTLEKTKLYHRPILSNLLSACIQRVSPFYRTSQLADSEGFDFHVWVFPGLSDAVEDETGALSLHRETKFIVGLDFAVTLSSPESFCVLFDITSEHSAELKWLNVKQTHKDDSIHQV